MTWPDLIGSRSKPHQSLGNSIGQIYKSELITNFAETCAADAQSTAAGKPVTSPGTTSGRGHVVNSNDAGSVIVLLPRRPATSRSQFTTAFLNSCLVLDGGTDTVLPSQPTRFARLEVRGAVIAGSVLSLSRESVHRRRDHLIRLSSIVSSRT